MTYIQKIRKKIGQDKFIHPAARIIVENEQGQILFIQRADNGKLGLPAGALEENETIAEAIIREVKEEAGLEILELEVIGISSNPNREAVQYPNGDLIQYFTVEFYSNNWTGELGNFDKNEVKIAHFLDRENAQHLPPNEKAAFESWAFFKKNGKIRVA